MNSPESLDLSAYTIRQLMALKQRIDAEIARKNERTRAWFDSRSRAGLVEREVRYRNPENPTQTWSGKGARPSWVSELLAKGRRLEELDAAGSLPAVRRDEP